MNTENLILNVDDDEAGRYAKSRILKRAGYEVVEAGTGADALRLVNESTPQLVLLDVKLPDINGMDVCRKIKEDPPAPISWFCRSPHRTSRLQIGCWDWNAARIPI